MSILVNPPRSLSSPVESKADPYGALPGGAVPPTSLDLGRKVGGHMGLRLHHLSEPVLPPSENRAPLVY